MDNQDAKSIYQQLGELKGGMTALITQITTGFGNFTRDIENTKNAVNNLGKEQDAHRENLRKELVAQMTGLEDQIEDLKQSRSKDQGAKEEANKRARITGATWGAGATIVFEFLKWLANVGVK